MPKKYIDIRMHFNTEVEEFGDEIFESTVLDSFERIKVKNLSESELDQIGESFGQMDSYQIALQNNLPYTAYSGITTTLKDL